MWLVLLVVNAVLDLSALRLAIGRSRGRGMAGGRRAWAADVELGGADRRANEAASGSA
jgi:hypothetical protein